MASTTNGFTPQGNDAKQNESRSLAYHHHGENSKETLTQKLSGTKYPHYLPTWTPNEKIAKPTPFEYYEHAKDADPTFPHLLGQEARTNHITPATGSEVLGVQLNSLSNQGKDELALLVAQRKVVVFRDQDFVDLPIPQILNYCSYFGKFSIHPVGPTAKGYPEIHIAHHGGGDDRLAESASRRVTSMVWHMDGSVESQPPGLVFLYMLECPEVGGDTVISNQVEAYKKLSPAFQERLHGLTTEHTDLDVIESTRKNGGLVRKEPGTAIYPLVRTHPVTREKGLFVNPIYTKRIIGYKKEESDALLKFLFDHIAYSQDCQARIRWAEKTVVIFDNRATCHSAIFDFIDQQRRRLLARVCLQAEPPYETPFEKR